jgi:hypothetical protein
MRQRQAIDLDEFERRLRPAPPPSKAADNPLAELARLVGQDDPFKVSAGSAPPAGGRGRGELRVELLRTSKESLVGADSRPGPAPFAELQAIAGTPSRADAAPPHWEREMAGDPRRQPVDEPMSGAPKPAAADDGSEPWLAQDAHLPPPPEQARRPARRSPRGFYAMVGVGGLALVTAAILYDFRDVSVMGSAEPPTIRAATGPAKVLPAPQATDDTATQKKVQTVPVRPDGTIVTGDSPVPAMAPIAAPPAMASVPPPTVSVAPAKAVDANKSGAAPLPKAATPKTAVHVAATPKPAAATGTNPTATPAMPTKPKQMAKASPPAPVSETDAAAQTPDNMPTGATSAATGGFAVQLAAPASEQEARDLAARLQKKFANELSGYHPTIYRADAAGHQVYRVRVVNLSHDDAVSLCEKLKSGGGACFIAKN